MRGADIYAFIGFARHETVLVVRTRLSVVDSHLSEIRLRFELFLVCDTGSSSSFRRNDYLRETKLDITDRDTFPIVCFNGKTSSKWIFASRKCFSNS